MENEIQLGDIVIYHMSTSDQNDMTIANAGMPFNSSNDLPAIIVAKWDAGCVNLKLIPDATHGDLWITSVVEGTGQRTYSRRS